ncbi:MAG: copper resistance CopC/CopD family protein [Frankiaceae bacterium]
MRPHRLLAALLVALPVAIVATLVMGTGVARAHAELIDSDPANGARLARPPALVTLLFDEQVQVRPGALRVLGSEGGDVATGEPFHPDGDPARVSVRLRRGLPDGSYVVRYAAVSADGHPIGGAAAFVVGDGPLIDASGAPTDARGTDPVVGAAYAASRWVAFCGLAGLGSLVFVAACWRAGATHPRVRRLVGGAWLAASAGSVATLLLQGPYGARRGIGAALSGDLLGDTLALPVGKVLMLRLVALVALAWVAAGMTGLLGTPARDAVGGGRPAETAGLLIALPLLGGFAGAGHAESGSQPTAVVISNMIHVGAMATWVGGLLTLALVMLPGAPQRDLAAALPPFGRLATWSVAVVVGTGCYQAWRQVGSLPATWETGYGRLLLAKIAGVMTVCLLGLVSSRAVRRGLLPRARPAVVEPSLRLAAGGTAGRAATAHPSSPASRLAWEVFEPGALRRLRAAATAEAAVSVVVLLLSALLVSTAPPRLSAGPVAPLGSAWLQ